VLGVWRFCLGLMEATKNATHHNQNYAQAKHKASRNERDRRMIASELEVRQALGKLYVENQRDGHCGCQSDAGHCETKRAKNPDFIHPVSKVGTQISREPFCFGPSLQLILESVYLFAQLRYLLCEGGVLGLRAFCPP